MDENGNIDLYNIGKTPEQLQKALRALRADYDSHIHDGGSSRAFQTLTAETVSVRALVITKTSYSDTTAGMWAGLVESTMQLSIGDATNYLKWTGSTLQISGAITGGSLNINNNAVIDSSGNATFVGITSLNLKAYTNFENSARFIVTGDVAPVFGNQGMTVAPGVVATHFSRALWWISNYVFNNNPSFTCSILALALNNATSNGQAYIGLGNPGVTGSGHSLGSINHCGFFFQVASGVTNVYAVQSDGSGGFAQSSVLTTIDDNDSLELFLKMKSTGVQYYFRKNGGAITGPTTLSTLIPSGGENYIHFSSTNKGTAVNYQIQIQCAAYEH